MNIGKKTFVTAMLVIAVVGILVIQTRNNNLFKGQIFSDNSEEAPEPAVDLTDALPDLTADLELLAPEQAGGNIIASITIKNNGPGTIGGSSVFRYALYFNEIEVLANVDSYTTMSSGDSFSFSYPVSRAIYQYEDSGSARVIVDTEDSIKEGNEDNNSAEETYNFQT